MNDALYDLCAAQHGVLSRGQALRGGVSIGEWRWLTRSGDWQRVYAGVYRRIGAPRTWEQTLMAGCLSANAIASHRAAATLWGLPDVAPRLEVTIPQSRRATLRGFEVHHTRFLQRVDRTHCSGIPVTSLARTVIDVSLAVPDIAPALVDHVLAKRKVPLNLLMDRLQGLGVNGRKGGADLLRLLDERRGRSRHVDSGLQRRLEKIALDAYRAGLLPEPSFEHPVQLSDGRWRYPDVGYPSVKTGFEAHSYEHHSTLRAFAADCERNLDLFGVGWTIVPITEVQVRNPARLVSQMARIVAARRRRLGGSG